RARPAPRRVRSRARRADRAACYPAWKASGPPANPMSPILPTVTAPATFDQSKARAWRGCGWGKFGGNPASGTALGHVGLGAPLGGGEGIEIDEQGIVGRRLALGLAGAMDVDQGLHAPGIEIVDMLVPQRE